VEFSLSTRWNAGRHTDGESMIDEILGLGIRRVELSYDLTTNLVPGVRNRVADGSVSVTSVHAFSPVPMGAPYGHPELFSLTDLSERGRQSAVLHTIKSVVFAKEVGARAVVSHAGRVEMANLTPKLISLAENGRQFRPRYEKLKFKLLAKRSRKAQKHINALYRSVEELLPDLEENGICLAFENLPYWEAVPTEMEARALLDRFDSPYIGYWHDIGHGQIRENLGFISQKMWVDALRDRLTGMHVHDVASPAFDHIMPPQGNVNFSLFKDSIQPDTILVIEPTPGTPADELKEAVRILTEAWQ